ncbi:STX18-like protein [Mya arenaria]|uniref:STX18-like protein n=1 Tax=Mya arenaria TaxID=6604 RepID=A0ABY7FK14_MYAAR|nr:STX18-like protein [Mya arenaria]
MPTPTGSPREKRRKHSSSPTFVDNMADLTNLFKATVKTVKSRNKGLRKSSDKDEASQIFPQSKNRGEFESTTKEVVRIGHIGTITKLRDFLLEHRKDYVNAGSHLTGEASQMTNTEREHIDNEAQNILRRCQDMLANFEQENKAMYAEMNSLSEELSKIQGKVVEIASLQEIFTDKVLTQEEDIVRIADTAVFTTENIKDGNEEIREAMRKNAGFRVWILFFLLVLTFSLLFLDWYSG